MLKLQKFTTFTYSAAGNQITMKIRRAKWGQVISLGELAMRSFAAVQKVDLTKGTLSDEETFSLLKSQADLLRAITPEALKTLFVDLVYDVEGLAVEDEPITTGEGLFDVADSDLAMSVLLHIYGASRLSALEGKGSSSPSTSQSVGSDAPASPAPSTESESGPGPSTATADPATESSGAPAT